MRQILRRGTVQRRGGATKNVVEVEHAFLTLGSNFVPVILCGRS
jgi:hypothetical protein